MNFSFLSNAFAPLLAENHYRLIDVEMPPIFGIPSFGLILLGLIVASFVIGYALEQVLRLKEYGWKIGLILSTTLVSTFIVLFGDFRLGVDLKGGVILVYEVDQKATAAMSKKGQSSDWNMDQLINVLKRRLNPDGLKEIVIRPFGSQQVEIVVPEVDPVEVAKIKRDIATAGVLQFMIVAGETDDGELLQLAREHAEQPGAERLSREVTRVNLEGQRERVGFWATLGREERIEGGGDPPFRSLELVGTSVLRGTQSGQLLELTAQERMLFSQSPEAFQLYLTQQGLRDVDVLLKYDSEFDMRGDDLSNSTAGHDPSTFGPAILFTMTTDGSYKMGYLTQNNLKRKLAIVFDNTLLSAPVIQSKIDTNGQITGKFTQAEVDFIVGILKSGSMPVVMQKQPTSENQIGAILGRDTIEQGSRAVVWALGLILVFMVAYYRVSGAIASFALALNLMLTVAIMVLLQAPFTLPGLAGLVLTVAMSVDANVLISERMREELAKGATLRMAIRNGFDKALSAIIDGNLTTFLTALVLYAIGTDQVRGFGITLMLGNVTSMFTAIFCARVLLDIGERTRWLKTLRMASFLTNPQIDWVRFFVPATIGSLLLIAVGIVATVARGRGLFDIDLAGGTSATFILQKSTPEKDVRDKLATVFKGLIDPDTKTTADYNVYQFRVNKEEAETVYKVDSSLLSVDMLKEKIREALRAPDGTDALRTYHVELGQVTEEPLDKPQPTLSAPGGPLSPTGPTLTPPIGTPPVTPPAKTGETPATPDAGKTPEKAAEPTSEKPADKGAEKPADKAGEPATEKTGTEKAGTEKATEKPASDNDAKEKAADKGAEPKADKAPEGNCQEPAKTEGAKADGSKTDEGKAADAGKADAGKTTPAQPEPATKTETPKATEPPTAATPPAAATPPDATTPPTATNPPATTPTIEAAPGVSSPLPGQPVFPEATVTPAKPAPPRTRVLATIRFPGTPLSGYALLDRIAMSSKATLGREVDALVKNPKWDGHDNSAYEDWTAELIGVSQADAMKLFTDLKQTLEKEVIWQTSSKIGGQVSADTRWRALGALAVSLLGIVAYVWFRFQKVAWGLAAVAALAHDALVMLTAIALSYWFAGSLGFLGIEEFKISLSVVAAFLAILGYSVNDTIVIFDRLREIRGKSPEVTRQMLNDAVNQTLSRNIILAGITVTVVLILYAFGGPGIHAFAFALMTGVISGCYTTLVIAAPLLLWLLNRSAAQTGGNNVTKRDAA